MENYEYTPTEAKWINKIPSHWECKKIGNLFTQRNEKVSDKVYEPLSVSKNGVVPQLESAVKTDAGDNRKLVLKGDFVINSRSDRKGSCGVSPLDGSVSLINIVLKPRQSWNEKYVHYLMRCHLFSEEYYRNGRGIVADLWTTRYSEMKSILLPVPPRKEQDQIVRYLDWQTAKINRLIAAKKQQIHVLREQQQKLICEVITKGVHSDVGYKDSHIAWIGDIPSHWSAIRCKYLFRERDERSKEGMETHLSMSQKYGLVPDSQLDERRMLSESYAGGKLCYQDDLVLNRLKAHLGVFALAPQFGVISPDYTVLIPNTERIIPSFGEMVLKSALCRRELRVRVRGIIEGFWRLYTDDFYTIYLPVPPIEEQKEIMQYIDAQAKKASAVENALNREIELLHELRTRLISDVVTGQIDVRSIEVPDFELVEEAADEAEEPADEMEVE